MLGILLIDKPLGCSSHDVVNDIRRRFHTKRVGHAGTLDPLATGLLVVAVGPATRFLQYLSLEPKRYVAEIRFGAATSTYDAEGKVVEERPVPRDLESRLQEVISEFLGLIRQLPPMFSAVKVAGKPLYRYARSGHQIEREPRSVHIGEIALSRVQGDTVTAQIECSGGTYIRTLAHDLGQRLGCGAYLAGLKRTRVGRFSLDDAIPMHEAEPDRLISLDEALVPMPLIELTDAQVRMARDGRPVGVSEPPTTAHVALVEPGVGVFSVARVNGNLLQPECVIPGEVMRDAV